MVECSGVQSKGSTYSKDNLSQNPAYLSTTNTPDGRSLSTPLLRCAAPMSDVHCPVLCFAFLTNFLRLYLDVSYFFVCV